MLKLRRILSVCFVLLALALPRPAVASTDASENPFASCVEAAVTWVLQLYSSVSESDLPAAAEEGEGDLGWGLDPWG